MLGLLARCGRIPHFHLLSGVGLLQVHPADLARFLALIDQPGYRLPELPDDLFLQTRRNSPNWCVLRSCSVAVLCCL
jgi:hypothetical protein